MTDRALKLTAAMDKLAQAKGILVGNDPLMKELGAEVWELWRKMESYRYDEIERAAKTERAFSF